MALKDAYKYLKTLGYDFDFFTAEDIHNVSIESEDLIEEIQEDLIEYGRTAKVRVFIRNIQGAYCFMDYALIEHDKECLDIHENEYGYVDLELEQAYELFKMQNSIIDERFDIDFN